MKQIKTLGLLILTLFCLLTGPIMMLFPGVIEGSTERIVGAIITLIGIPLGIDFYKKYKGKKVVKEFINQ